MTKTLHKPVIMIDFHGVYFESGARQLVIGKISKKFSIPGEKISPLLSMSNPYRRKYSTGEITGAQFWGNIMKKLGLNRKQSREMELLWHSSYKIMPGMRELVRKLRRKYRVVVLSGNFKERIDFLQEKFNIDKEFHEQHYSFQYGVNKPDARLFVKVVEKMSLKPEDCIMIDDLENFLSGVREAGGNAILFKNAKQLEADLKKLGVKI